MGVPIINPISKGYIVYRIVVEEFSALCVFRRANRDLTVLTVKVQMTFLMVMLFVS